MPTRSTLPSCFTALSAGGFMLGLASAANAITDDILADFFNARSMTVFTPDPNGLQDVPMNIEADVTNFLHNEGGAFDVVVPGPTTLSLFATGLAGMGLPVLVIDIIEVQFVVC